MDEHNQEMSCDRVQAQLRAGADLDVAGEAHLDGCVECMAVAVQGEGLAPGAHAVELPGFDGLLADVEAAVAAERGPLAWLRGLPSAARLALGLAAALGVPLAVGALTLRADFGVYPRARFALIGVTLAVAVAAAIRVALRPLHRAPLAHAWVTALTLASIAALALIASLPSAHQLHAASLAGVGADFARRALACLAFGAAVGVPVAFAARALGRGGPTWLGSPLMAPLAGAVAGNLALHLHCPLVAPAHLLAGHFTVLAPFALAVAVVAVRWRRAAARS